MVDPALMCRRHLLGEHVELHMLAGHLRCKRQVTGYVAHNCVEPRAIEARHTALMVEMVKRGYRHASPLRQPSIVHLPPAQRTARVDRRAALADLTGRCAECKNREYQSG